MKTIQSFEDLNSGEFQQRLKEDTKSVLLDVRTQEEFKRGRIPGSVNMDWHYVGCLSGSCAITSSPVNSTIYGSVMGGLLFNMFKPTNKKDNTKRSSLRSENSDRQLWTALTVAILILDLSEMIWILGKILFSRNILL